MTTNIQSIFVDLSKVEAEAFSEFLKRVGFAEFRSLAKTDQEAYAMQEAACKIAKGLAEKGFNPR